MIDLCPIVWRVVSSNNGFGRGLAVLYILLDSQTLGFACHFVSDKRECVCAIRTILVMAQDYINLKEKVLITGIVKLHLLTYSF